MSSSCCLSNPSVYRRGKASARLYQWSLLLVSIDRISSSVFPSNGLFLGPSSFMKPANGCLQHCGDSCSRPQHYESQTGHAKQALCFFRALTLHGTSLLDVHSVVRTCWRPEIAHCATGGSRLLLLLLLLLLQLGPVALPWCHPGRPSVLPGHDDPAGVARVLLPVLARDDEATATLPATARGPSIALTSSRNRARSLCYISVSRACRAAAPSWCLCAGHVATKQRKQTGLFRGTGVNPRV